ncbi:MAG: hypothetical protein HXX20_13855 [Chloroflexi bacterium]|nr:hypothetical protein [Chloroflexota bacterium]
MLRFLFLVTGSRNNGPSRFYSPTLDGQGQKGGNSAPARPNGEGDAAAAASSQATSKQISFIYSTGQSQVGSRL